MTWRIKSGYRENAVSKTWEGNQAGVYWTEDRVRLAGEYQYEVYLTARALIAGRSSCSALDVGSGPGVKAGRLLLPVVGSLVLVDQPSVASLVARHCPGSTFFSADLETVDLDLGRTFDVIVCADVVEHLVDPTPCMQFVRRHCGAASAVVFSTPERDYLYGASCMACDKPEHVREWNGTEFAMVLQDQGFEVTAHYVCPQIRSPETRGDESLVLTQPFTPCIGGGPDDGRDPTRACQICVCRPGTPPARIIP